jgi:hypothetical protein
MSTNAAELAVELVNHSRIGVQKSEALYATVRTDVAAELLAAMEKVRVAAERAAAALHGDPVAEEPVTVGVPPVGATLTVEDPE